QSKRRGTEQAHKGDRAGGRGTGQAEGGQGRRKGDRQAERRGAGSLSGGFGGSRRLFPYGKFAKEYAKQEVPIEKPSKFIPKAQA
ncbi:MAG: hypothetical protein LBD13_06325, partial [Spirochaetaceae bacterium]|nr:hypothetical protein [Spirochaetaceae bacterium]